ncbi:DUF192 domain-containing protein [Nitratireductor sp. ZSWI3]|uniref:DUF192 domain-containing protein n=1 Tax=Nitratireductor sp. ZSWI3 TaxID=2966359 RepID=UPI00214F61B8|nr:DUF192 domain-containing protein [Nitratireductor sp. ZSWI3]MCR4266460.1 DUF192 domain-containing protein [Nitratireductor sp. ZSWI3]
MPLFLFAGVLGAAAQTTVMRLPVDPDPLVIETAAGERQFRIEIADEASERQRGLMFRQSMPDDRGMLFIFPAESRQGFWMQNTPLPLDLLFIGADGVVRAIGKGVPFSTESISPDVESQFVLELVAGTAQKSGIEVGDRLRHPRIEAPAGR